MPATSDKQERFMQAVAHNPKFAKKVGVKQKVGKEFVGMADGGEVEKPRKGGNTAYIESAIDEATGENAQRRALAKKELPPGSLAKEGLTPAEKAKRAKGPPEEMLRRHATFAKGGSIDGCAQRGKTRGKVV